MMNNKQIIIFSMLGLIWIGSIILIMAPSLGLVTPVFPRPQPVYELVSMLISGVFFAGYSLKTGISYLKSK